MSELAHPSDVKGARRVITTRAETLSEVLLRHGNPTVDFLCLDVEGYEVEVLKGLNISVTAPRLILIETDTPQLVVKLLGTRYILREKCTCHDYLFERTNQDKEC